MEVDELIDQVTDQQSLLRFVRALVEDRKQSLVAETANPSAPYGPDARGWENVTIESFLDSATSWAESTRFGETQGLTPENPWRQFAVFLYCGKIYE